MCVTHGSARRTSSIEKTCSVQVRVLGASSLNTKKQLPPPTTVCCESHLNAPATQQPTEKQMASFADAVNALVAERDRQFVQRIATEYSLNFDELNKKYLETAEMAIKVPRKYTKKAAKEPKSVEVGEGAAPDATQVAKAPKVAKEKPCCTAQTSKKEPCKFSALKGEVFCKRHLKQSQEETAPKEPKAPKAPKAAKKAEQPVHTHPLTETDEACDLCASHGNPLEETERDFEVVPHCGPVKQLTTEQRLAAILNSGDSEPEDEDEGDKLEAAFDEYEEDD